jgi:riboflavin biosynthesis pyrimidine reductase
MPALPHAPMNPAADAVRALDLAALASAQRPYVVLNMVASVDGRASIDGRSAPLSPPADREVFHALRGAVDAVLDGTETLRRERPPRFRPRPDGTRPLAVVLTRSGDVPDVPQLADGAVVLREAPRPALARLRAEHGVRALLCEGGPALNRALLDAELVDELFLTVSPLLAADESAPTVVAGGPLRVDLELLWAHAVDGALFLRYRVSRAHG